MFVDVQAYFRFSKVYRTYMGTHGVFVLLLACIRLRDAPQLRRASRSFTKTVFFNIGFLYVFHYFGPRTDSSWLRFSIDFWIDFMTRLGTILGGFWEVKMRP